MKENVNLLVVGSGGREHAICKALLKSEKVAKVYCAPGNPGMTFDGIEVVAIDELDFDALKGFVYDNDIEWTFVGPEDALVAGIVDSFREDNLKIFGPDKRAAQLEGSKIMRWNLWISIIFQLLNLKPILPQMKQSQG